MTEDHARIHNLITGKHIRIFVTLCAWCRCVSKHSFKLGIKMDLPDNYDYITFQTI